MNTIILNKFVNYQEQQVCMCAREPRYINCYFPYICFVQSHAKIPLTAHNKENENSNMKQTYKILKEIRETNKQPQYLDWYECVAVLVVKVLEYQTVVNLATSESEISITHQKKMTSL